MMVFEGANKKAAALLTMVSLFPAQSFAQQPHPDLRYPEASERALPLPEDRGAAALSQSLKRLSTWASLMFIVAHPDDEDGSMLTYESRSEGARTSLLTLTRGEGGQNAIGADTYDALGLIRTNELLKADEYYGVRQYWGTEADFGFSKTQEEAFAKWGHERVLCDTVLAIRQERPLVLVSTFIGGITDGHGHHQVSGEISQEAFLAAGDPNVCRDQITAGLLAWSPLKVYARVPFARVSDGRMFDYATGKSAPARFYNYVTKEWSSAEPAANVSIPAGQYDPILGRSYIQIARQGWGEQKSQYGGANPALSGGDGAEYHRYGSRIKDQKDSEESFFDGIPTGMEGLASLISTAKPDWLETGLKSIALEIGKARTNFNAARPQAIAPTLKAGYEATRSLRDQVAASRLSEGDRATLSSELDLKLQQFQSALAQSLGLDLQAFTVHGRASQNQGPFSGGIDETPRSVSPGQPIQVQIHTGDAFGKAKLARVWLQGSDSEDWKAQPADTSIADTVLTAIVPADAQPTEPYFSRPTIEQPYYDIAKPAWRGRSFAPYPLTAWAEFTYDGLAVRLGEIVQTMRREAGIGGVFQPLVITPSIGVSVEPEARILPLDGSPLPVRVTLHSQAAAEGTLRLILPAGWNSTPSEASFRRTQPGDSEPILFLVKPPQSSAKTGGEFAIRAQAESNGHTYASGWSTIGYPGLRPYNLYRPAEMKTRAIDVKIAPRLKVAYVMGTGDTVPEAMEGLGITPHLLSANELAYSDLSAWDTIVVGIRAYAARPDLTASQLRLNAFVQAGGTLIVQYQSDTFPAPFPLSMGRTPERVVQESTPVKILTPNNSLLTYPNRISSADFDGWIEERGHSFLDSWDPAYTPLTETADAGQDPQQGGLVVAHPGKGIYVYAAYALYRQFPELVPGSYRIMANLLSAGRAPLAETQQEAAPAPAK